MMDGMMNMTGGGMMWAMGLVWLLVILFLDRPSLAELWNRKAAGLSSFSRYSPALKSSGIIWDDKTLDEWLKDPQH
jgi:hypothetical protein